MPTLEYMKYLGHVTLKGNGPNAREGVVVYAQPVKDGDVWYDHDPALLVGAPPEFDGRPAAYKDNRTKPAFLREQYWLVNPRMMQYSEIHAAGGKCLLLEAYAKAGIDPGRAKLTVFVLVNALADACGYSRVALAFKDPVQDPLRTVESLPRTDPLPAPMDARPKVQAYNEEQAKQAAKATEAMRIVKD